MNFFGKNFGQAFAQTLEAVGNIVAPLPDDESYAETNSTSTNVPSGSQFEDSPNYYQSNSKITVRDDMGVHGSPSYNEDHYSGSSGRILNYDGSQEESYIAHQDSPVSYLSDVDLNDDISKPFNLIDPSPFLNRDQGIHTDHSVPTLSSISSFIKSSNPLDESFFGESRPSAVAALTGAAAIVSNAVQASSSYISNANDSSFFTNNNSHAAQKNSSSKLSDQVLNNNDLEQDNEKLLSRISLLEIENSKLSNTIRRYSEIEQSRRSELDLISDLKSELSSEKLKNQQISDKLKSVENSNNNAITATRSQLESKDKTIQQLENQIKSLTESLSEAQTLLERNMLASSQNNDLYVLKQQLNESQEAYKQQFQQTSELLNSLSNLSSKDKENQMAILEYKSVVESKNEIIKSKETQLKEFTTSIANLESKCKEQIALSNQYETELQLKTNALNNFLEKEQKYEQQIAQLKDEISSLKSLNINTPSSISSNDSELKILQKQLEDVRSQLERAQIETVEIQQQSMMATNDAKELRVDIEKYKKQLNDIEGRFLSQSLEMEALEKQFNETKSELLENLKLSNECILERDVKIAELTQQLATLQEWKQRHEAENVANSDNSGKDEEIISLLSQIQLLESRLSLHSTTNSHEQSLAMSTSVISERELLSKLISDIRAWIDQSEHPAISINSDDLIRVAIETINDLKSLVIQANEELDSRTSEWNKRAEDFEKLRLEANTANHSNNCTTEANLSNLELIQQQKMTISSLEQELEDLQIHFNKIQGELLAKVSSHSQTQHQKDEYETTKLSLQNELIAVKNELSLAEDALQSTKSKLFKAEAENKQYQTVISQLRSARKVNKEDIDTVLQERDELRRKVENSLNENQRLSKLLSQANDDLAKYQSYDKDMAALRENLRRCEEGLAREQLEKSSLQKAKYDMEVSIDIMKTDILILKKDLEQRELEVSNLYSTVTQFEKDKEAYRRKMKEDSDRQLEIYRKRMDEDVETIETVWKDKLNKLELVKKEIELKLQDEVLLRRKAEMDINQDRRKMQQTLNDTLDRLKNSQEDVVDRAIVANLIVSYFKRKRSLDVLDLIAKVLNFNEDQKVAVGLKPPPINIVTSLFKSIVGAPSKPVEVDGDNLAELWVNFLLLETEGDQKLQRQASSSTSPRSDTSSQSELKSIPLTPPKSKHHEDYVPSPVDSDLGAISLEPDSPVFLKDGNKFKR